MLPIAISELGMDFLQRRQGILHWKLRSWVDHTELFPWMFPGDTVQCMLEANGVDLLFPPFIWIILCSGYCLKRPRKNMGLITRWDSPFPVTKLLSIIWHLCWKKEAAPANLKLDELLHMHFHRDGVHCAKMSLNSAKILFWAWKPSKNFWDVLSN